MARLVLQHFSNLKPGQLKVCNRDLSKAESLAAAFSAQALPFELLADHLVTADIVITSTGATQPIITRKQFENRQDIPGCLTPLQTDLRHRHRRAA